MLIDTSKGYVRRLIASQKVLFILALAVLAIAASINTRNQCIGHFQSCGYLYNQTNEPRMSRQRLYGSDSRVCARAEERFYKMIMDKHAYVEQLLHNHKSPTDKLQLRLNFVECTANHKLSEMLRRNSTAKGHALSVIADMKRRTPTCNPKCDNTVLSYLDAAEVGKNMAQVGFDVIFVNTDEISYGGHILELHKCFLELRKLGRRIRPAIVMKDIILHPIQIAQAAEYRADGVLLNAAILGNALKDMILSCITMGIEAIVEVHTAAEAMKALDMGAAHLMVNQWSRVDNVLKPTRALEVKEIVGDRATLIAAGGIVSYNQVHELGLIGYDAVVLGRRLMYNDVPEFVGKVKSWRAPCKGILNIIKPMLFDISETNDESMIKIKLKDNHHKTLAEMNTFYGHDTPDASEIMTMEQPSDPSLQQMKVDIPSENQEATQGDNGDEKVITVTCGNPVNTTFVRNIWTSPESPDSMIDAEQYFAEQKEEMYQMKWYIERRKWIKRFRHHFKSREDAEKAYELKTAVQMYTVLKKVGLERMRRQFPQTNVERMQHFLTEKLKKAYEEAPRDEKGNVILPR